MDIATDSSDQKAGMDEKSLKVSRDADLESASISGDAPDRDPNVVDWDGPDDPENPMNWSTTKKFATIALVALVTFVTPTASSIFAPGIQQVMSDFNSTNDKLASFVVSVYLLGYCFGPLVIAPISEINGRLPVYHVCNVLFVIWNVACALAPNLASLIVFRFLAGLAGSCPLTIGASSIADIVPRERRGAAMSAWVLGPLLGPVVGPIAGGYLTQAKGWRWAFWLVSILGGVVMIVALLFMRETYAYTILERKTKKLQKETDNPKRRSALDTGRDMKDLIQVSVKRPMKMLFFSPIVFLLSLYTAIVYGYLYLVFTILPSIFKGQYGFSTGSVGLSYLGMGVGSFIGLCISGTISDWVSEFLTKKHGGEVKPEYRLPPLYLGSVLVPLGLFIFGWTAEKHLHWIIPIIGTAFLGMGLNIAFMGVSTYLVDAYGAYSASAMAANTVLRSLLGALLPLAGPDMYKALGYGWGTSLLAFIALAMVPVPFWFYKKGESIRKHNLFGMQF